MSKVNEMNEFFGEVISCYSRKQALEDGVLVDLNKFIEKSSNYSWECLILRSVSITLVVPATSIIQGKTYERTMGYIDRIHLWSTS
jgi:hypothetical protein